MQFLTIKNGRLLVADNPAMPEPREPPQHPLEKQIGGLYLQIEARDKEIGRLRTAFRINALRWGFTDAEINAVLDLKA